MVTETAPGFLEHSSQCEKKIDTLFCLGLSPPCFLIHCEWHLTHFCWSIYLSTRSNLGNLIYFHSTCARKMKNWITKTQSGSTKWVACIYGSFTQNKCIDAPEKLNNKNPKWQHKIISLYLRLLYSEEVLYHWQYAQCMTSSFLHWRKEIKRKSQKLKIDPNQLLFFFYHGILFV